MCHLLLIWIKVTGAEGGQVKHMSRSWTGPLVTSAHPHAVTLASGGADEHQCSCALPVESVSCMSALLQFTEEKLGQAEKTELDAHFENLMSRADCTKNWTEKIYRQTEVLLQPNPSMTSIQQSYDYRWKEYCRVHIIWKYHCADCCKKQNKGMVSSFIKYP